MLLFSPSLTTFEIIKYKVLVFFLGMYKKVLLILEINLPFIWSMIIIWGFEKYFISFTLKKYVALKGEMVED